MDGVYAAAKVQAADRDESALEAPLEKPAAECEQGRQAEVGAAFLVAGQPFHRMHGATLRSLARISENA